MNIILGLTGLFILLGFYKPSSRILASAIFIFMWLVMGWNVSNPDYFAYEFRYENLFSIDDIFDSGIPDAGFSLIIIAAKTIGLDYQSFRIVLALISLLLIYSTILKYSLYPALVSMLYLMSIFVLDITQIRNFLAFSIIFYAVRYLFMSKIKGSIIFSAYVLLATLIHSSSSFFYLFLLSYFNISVISIVVVALVVFSYKTIFKAYYSSLFNRSVLFDAYSQGISLFAFISIILVQIINYYYIALFGKTQILLTDVAAHVIKKPKQLNELTYGEAHRVNDAITYSNATLIPFISLCLFLLIPFYQDNMTYGRLFKYTVLFNFIYVTNHNYGNLFQSRFFNTFMLVLYTAFIFWYFVIFTNGYDHVIYPILVNNPLFN